MRGFSAGAHFKLKHGLVDVPVPISPPSGLWSKPRVVDLRSIKGDGLEGSGPSQPTVVPSGIMLAQGAARKKVTDVTSVFWQGFFLGLLLLPGWLQSFLPPWGGFWANCAGYWASKPWS